MIVVAGSGGADLRPERGSTGSRGAGSCHSGSARRCDWWLNLHAAAEGTIVLRGRRTAVRPRVLKGDEREEAYERFCEMYPHARSYRSFTDRPLPLVTLEPIE